MRLFCRIAATALLTAPLLAGCDIQVGEHGISVDAGGGFADEWRRTYTLPEGGRLEINNGNGSIEVSQAAGREVEVVVERRFRGGSDDEARKVLESLKMIEDVSPGGVTIRAERLDENVLRSLGRNRLTLKYVVRVPSGLNLVLATGNGDVQIEDVTGTIDASTTNGGIAGDDISGAMKATAVNGGIQIEMAALTGDVEVSVTNGGVRLELPIGVKANLSASCVNGGIEVDEELRLEASEQSRRQVTGTLNGGGPRIVASTVNGGIRIDARAGEGTR